MTKNECNQLITCVEHRLRYLRKSLLGNLTADSRQCKNDELNDLLPLERKLKEFLKRFPEKDSPY